MQLRLILVLKEFIPLHKHDQHDNQQYATPRVTFASSDALVELCLCLVLYDTVQSG